jgi:hypothetical protein
VGRVASSQVSRASGLELQSANIGLQTASAPATRACNKGLQQGPPATCPRDLHKHAHNEVRERGFKCDV